VSAEFSADFIVTAHIRVRYSLLSITACVCLLPTRASSPSITRPFVLACHFLHLFCPTRLTAVIQMSDSNTSAASKRSHKRKSTERDTAAAASPPSASPAAEVIVTPAVAAPSTAAMDVPAKKVNKNDTDSDVEFDELDPCRGGRRRQRPTVRSGTTVCVIHHVSNCDVCVVEGGVAAASNGNSAIAVMEAMTDRMDQMMDKLHKIEVSNATMTTRDSGINGQILSGLGSLVQGIRIALNHAPGTGDALRVLDSVYGWIVAADRGRAEVGFRDCKETVEGVCREKSVARSMLDHFDRAVTHAIAEKKEGGTGLTNTQSGERCYRCGRGNHQVAACVAATRNAYGKDMSLPLAAMGTGRAPFAGGTPVQMVMGYPSFSNQQQQPQQNFPMVTPINAPTQVFGPNPSNRRNGGGGACFRCGGHGHMARDCSVVLGPQQQQQPSNTTR